MSMETREWLQEFILVGNADKRPRTWHDDPKLRERLGLPSNHFEGPIPYSVVVERLFNWKAQAVPTANLIPCLKNSDGNYDHKPEVWLNVMKDGKPVMRNGRNVQAPHWISQSTRQGIVRSDNHLELGNHGAGYQIHDYEKWLLQLQSNVIGDSLSILGAGLLRNGAQAFVQVALPQTAFDDSTGMEFWPYIMASTSLDGSIATTFSGQTLYVVCDNTRDCALRQAENAGRIFKAKHTSNSLETSRIGDVRQALGIISQTADNMLSEIHELAAIKVTPRQEVKIMDIILPLPQREDADFTERKLTIAENKRETFIETLRLDKMVSDWRGTALGVVHGANTYATHYTTIHGDRVLRNFDRIIKGKFNEFDSIVVNAVAEVTGHPELVSSK